MSKIFNIKVVTMLLPLFFFVYSGYSQCNNVIWFEDFESYPDGTQNAVKWTTSAGNCDDNGDPAGTINGNYWGVENGEFRVNDIEGLTCCGSNGGGNNDNWFLTEDIDISMYSNISISIKLRAYDSNNDDFECVDDGDGCNAADELIVQYNVDNNGWNTFARMCGVNANYISIDCFDISGGNILKIRIVVGNQSNYENYYFDDIYVCEDICSVVLPIELLSFNGEYNQKTGMNDLKWITASESNNDRFEIYSSIDGEFWEMIGTVNGAGNTTIEQSYKFNHRSEYNLTYYRLKQIDFNGNFEYSNIISISKKGDKIIGYKYYDLLGKELPGEPISGLFIKVIEYQYRTEYMRIFKQ